MRSLRLMARPGPLLEAVEIDLAPPGPRQMLVRVERSYVSAGTEMNYYRENPPGRAATPAPLGYMTVGTVEVMGSAIEGYAVGERVLTAGYHGAHWLVDLDDAGPAAWYIERLDPAHDLDSVGFVILADIALHGVRRARLQIDQSVAVFGVGLIGQLTLQLARLSGAYPLIAVDLYPSRLDKARVSGASHVVDAATDDPVAAIRAITGGVGAEIAQQITERAFDSLDGPVVRVAAVDVPVPASAPLESAVFPQAADIVRACQSFRRR